MWDLLITYHFDILHHVEIFDSLINPWHMYIIGQNFIFASGTSDVINSKETVLHSNPDFHIAFTKKNCFIYSGHIFKSM